MFVCKDFINPFLIIINFITCSNPALPQQGKMPLHNIIVDIFIYILYVLNDLHYETRNWSSNCRTYQCISFCSCLCHSIAEMAAQMPFPWLSFTLTYDVFFWSRCILSSNAFKSFLWIERGGAAPKRWGAAKRFLFFADENPENLLVLLIFHRLV